jgi:hypothetical protein
MYFFYIYMKNIQFKIESNRELKLVGAEQQRIKSNELNAI